MSSEVLKKVKNGKLIIIFFLISVALFALAFVIPNKIGVRWQNFLDNRSSIYESVYLEIDSKPVEFETVYKGNKRSFYIVSNADKYFIVKLSDKQYEEILIEYEKVSDNFKYVIEGRSNAIFTNLQDSAKKTFNELKNEKIITSSNFEDYFGSSYIDVEDNTKGMIKTLCLGFGILFIVIDVIVIIGYVYGLKTYKKMIKKYGKEELEKELNDKDVISLSKAGIYLTKKYIISNSMGFKVIEYKDVGWVYILKRRTNGILTGSHLMIYQKNGKGDTFASMRRPEELKNLIPVIAEKNKSILVGYTKDNQKKYKEMVKEYKK